MKFATRMSTNQSQVLRGGIFAGPVPFGPPGLASAGGTCPAGAESLVRPFGCPVRFMLVSSAMPEHRAKIHPQLPGVAGATSAVDENHLHPLTTNKPPARDGGLLVSPPRHRLGVVRSPRTRRF